eukprot:1359276-Ditylum_brightwellii.AAC.1
MDVEFWKMMMMIRHHGHVLRVEYVYSNLSCRRRRHDVLHVKNENDNHRHDHHWNHHHCDFPPPPLLHAHVKIFYSNDHDVLLPHAKTSKIVYTHHHYHAPHEMIVPQPHT